MMRTLDICTQDVVSIGPDASIHQAAQLMRTRHVGCLVVTEGSNGERVPIGILTDRDIVIGVVAPDIDIDVLTVGDVMSSPVTCCNGEGELFDALERMREAGIRRLPVVNELGGLIGLLSSDDAVAALGWHLHELTSALTSEQVREMTERV
ncbi:MAG: CBS domain-containing protein [Xanthomonadaceae bacterium]|nr:CBS domain-containing protein [Xanthomonadaceae bacterium]